MPDSNPYLGEVRQIIAEHGVMIQGVAEGEDGESPFAYTVGLAAIDQPELIVFGLDAVTSHGILNSMAMTTIKENVRWLPGPSDQVFGGGVAALLIEVTDSREHLTVANAIFARPGQDPLPALQAVYPDRQGRWPWEDGSTVADDPVLGPIP